MPPSPRRLLICTDAKNEADDQFAVVHALLTPTLDVRGIIPSHFGRPGSMEASRQEVRLLLELLGMDVVVADGSPRPLPDARTPSPSAGAELIASEGGVDAGTLFIAVLGPLTDVASALLMEPWLRDRDIVVVWVGGPPYEGIPAYAPEFNLINDVAAAHVVLQSGLEVWQIPMSVYTMVGVGHAELEERLRGTGPVGDYLVDQLVAFNATVDYGPMDFRSLGDSPAIGAVMNPAGARWTRRATPSFTEVGGMLAGSGETSLRVCESFDTRWLIEDMFAKVRSAGSPRTR